MFNRTSRQPPREHRASVLSAFTRMTLSEAEGKGPHLPSGHCAPRRCKKPESSPSLRRRHRNQCTGSWCSRLTGCVGCSGWRLPPWGSHPQAPSWLPPPWIEGRESGGGQVLVGASHSQNYDSEAGKRCSWRFFLFSNSSLDFTLQSLL